MLDRILLAIRSARPRLRLRAEAVVEAILLTKGSIGSAETVARALGLKNRFRLARFLHDEGLPPLHRLTEWITVLNWIGSAEHDDVSLCWMAFRSHRHPSACYRLVKEVTGHGWEDVRGHGSDWAMRQFLKELRGYRPVGTPAPPPERRVSLLTNRVRARRHGRVSLS